VLGLFFKIFGKVSNKAISKIIEINGRAGGEVTEETIQELLQIHRESGSFNEMIRTVGEMFESSDGEYSDAFKLFVQSYTMGMAFGTGSTLSTGMFNFAQKQQNNIPANEQVLAKQYVEELNETYLLALEVAVTPDAQTSTTGTNVSYTITKPISAPSYVTILAPTEITTNNLQDNLLFYENLLQQGVVNVRYANVEISVEQAISVLKTGDVEGFKKLFESSNEKSSNFDKATEVKRVGENKFGTVEVPIDKVQKIHGVPKKGKSLDYIDILMNDFKTNGYNLDLGPPIEGYTMSDGKVIIIDGHHRLAALEKLGETSIPIRIAPTISLDGLRLMLKIGEYSGFYPPSTYPKDFILPDFGPERNAEIDLEAQDFIKNNF